MRIYTFLHPELMTREAPVVIMAKVDRLETLKREYYELNNKKNELEKIIKQEEAELNKIRGVLYDYTDEPDNDNSAVERCPVEKVNIVFKGLSNSKL